MLTKKFDFASTDAYNDFKDMKDGAVLFAVGVVVDNKNGAIRAQRVGDTLQLRFGLLDEDGVFTEVEDECSTTYRSEKGYLDNDKRCYWAYCNYDPKQEILIGVTALDKFKEWKKRIP